MVDAGPRDGGALSQIDRRGDDQVGRVRSFVSHIGRFVELAVDQGTRLVDVMDRWVGVAERQAEATEEHARQTGRLADAMSHTDEE